MIIAQSKISNWTHAFEAINIRHFSKTFISTIIFLLLPRSPNMSFTCPTCYQTLESIETLQNHERRYHPKSSDIQIKCERCKKMFSKTANLKAHNLRFHSDKRVKSDISSISSSENMNTSGIPTKHILIQDDEVENNQVIDRNYNSDLMMLAEVQRRNTAMIKENSLQLLKILNIVNSLLHLSHLICMSLLLG